MLLAFKEVFKNVSYSITVFVIAVFIFSFLILLPNLELIFRVGISSSASFSDLLSIMAGLIMSVTTSFSVLSVFYIVTISFLFSINILMVIYYIKMFKKIPRMKETASSVGGMVGGVLGVGCVACGSILLSPILSLLGVSAAVAFFPLKGSEFGILGIIALLFSISIIAKKINKGNTC